MEALKSEKTKLNLRINSELKKNFMKLANLENTNATELLTGFIQQYIDEKIKENGLYALFLSQDYLSDNEEKELVSSMQNLTKEDMDVAHEEIIEI